MADELQKELFEEFKSEKGKIKRIADRVSEKQRKVRLQVPLENAIFLSILIIMCLVVVYAMGIERGKRLPAKKALPEIPEQAVKIQDVPKEPAMAAEAAAPAEAEKGSPDKALPYTIQVAVYAYQSRAENEKNKLARQDADAFVITRGNMYHVCVGSYASVKEAEKDRVKFSKKYKDCFVRRK